MLTVSPRRLGKAVAVWLLIVISITSVAGVAIASAGRQVGVATTAGRSGADPGWADAGPWSSSASTVPARVPDAVPTDGGRDSGSTPSRQPAADPDPSVTRGRRSAAARPPARTSSPAAPTARSQQPDGQSGGQQSGGQQSGRQQSGAGRTTSLTVAAEWLRIRPRWVVRLSRGSISVATITPGEVMLTCSPSLIADWRAVATSSWQVREDVIGPSEMVFRFSHDASSAVVRARCSDGAATFDVGVS
jgi:hypothetical protein